MQKVELVDIIEKPISGEWGEDDYVGNGKFVLRTTNFTNEGVINYSNVVTRAINKIHLENKYLRDGDILIEKSGGSDKQPVGRVVYFDGKPNTYLFNNFTSLLRVKEKKASKRYVFYFLFYNYLNGKTRAFQNKTTGLHNLKLEPYLRSLKLLLPPIEEQKAIAEQLDKVSILIEKRKQQLSQLDFLVKSQFIEMFGDPITNAKLWTTDTVERVCERIYGGGTPSKSRPEFYDGQIPWVTPKDMKTTTIVDSVDHITEDAIKCSATNIVPKGAVLMVIRSGILKHTLPVALSGNIVTINQDMKAFVVRKEIINAAFLLHYFKKKKKDVLSEVRGVTADNIDFKAFVKRKVILPPIDLQNQFAAFVEQTDKSKFRVKQSLAALELLKKSLMQKYFG